MAEAATMLDCSVSTIERRIEKGDILNSFKLGRKRVIPIESIKIYIDRQRKKGGVL